MDHSAVSPAHLVSTRLRAPLRLLFSIRRADRALRRIPREELSPAGMWIEDHARFLLGEGDALEHDLRSFPRLPGNGKTPRILELARHICREGKDDIQPSLILRVSKAYFSQEEITLAELNALPAALRTALFERLQTILAACLKEQRCHEQANQWIRSLEKGKKPVLPHDALLLEKILSLLSVKEESAALHFLDGLLAREGTDAEKAAAAAHEEMTKTGQEAARIISSLRRLSHLPLEKIRRRLSPLEQIFRAEETYRSMDNESREHYQSTAARIARRLHVQETAVARAAMALSRDHQGAEGEAGYYLLERSDLIAAYLLKKKSKPLGEKKKQLLFLLPLYGGALLCFLLCLYFRTPFYLIPLILLTASEIIRIPYFRWLHRRFPPRILPKIQFSRLSAKERTLVVVPTLLASRKQALQMIRQLSVLRCANPQKHLEFMLLADFSDSPHETEPEDDAIIRSAAAALNALNQSRGGGFFYLHRERSWDKGQQRFSGRERKRGALEALNLLITQGQCPDRFCFSSCNLSSLHRRYTYVITLDADTFLPPGTALKLIGAMAHPLQKGRVGVIQPRMEVAADTVRTHTQRLLGGQGGVDPYNLASQDLYQDLFSKGSFIGKGIYEPGLWLERLDGNIPQGRLLSHDLIEGEFVQSALAADIVLYDGHPARLAGWQKRLHRWTRGDWQLLPFLKNSKFSLLSRHKILDNMRRSLLPFAQLLLLFFAAFEGNPLLCLLGLPWPLRGMGNRLLLLPAKAFTLMDAVCHALYRQFISHQGLLSWVTAAQAEKGGSLPLSCLLIQLLAGTGMTAFSLLPQGFLPLVFLGLAWVLSPLIARWADQKIKGEPGFTPAQKEQVRTLARSTWHFFEEYVTEDTHFLPPDNVQTEPDKGPALRTSPTNIGLYMLSCVSARELGFITTKALFARLSQTLSTLETLEKWKGHLYNWYDLQTNVPLPPRFVSSVDSGNLAGCLMACAQSCRMRLGEADADVRDLPARLDALAGRMDFSALFDRADELFYVGWDAQNAQPTPAHYDLLASEARLTSLIAVMQGQVPLSHWKKLGRTAVRAGGGPALLSWGGTLFEYLLPALLLPLTPGTLLGESCFNAVRAQISAHPRRPFGISECGYYAFDPDLNYQYRAFGLPRLALSGETAGEVIAPYASMLALPFFPRAAADNLSRMQRMGWQDAYGLFEAADYSPQRVEKVPRPVMSHMAHHQGMILCAACNALTDFSLVRAFMAPPAARAHAYLLLEKAPRKIRRRPELPPPREESPAAHPLGRIPRRSLPVDAHALHGGGMTWLISARGQGYISFNGMMITRFFEEADTLSGPQFYLRDEKTGQAIMPALQGKAYFEPGIARFSCEFSSLHCTSLSWIAPLSATAFTALQIENPAREEKQIEAVSFLEICQSSQTADRAHPNFRDLSVRIEKQGGTALLSRRLPRDEKDKMPLIGHAAAGDFYALRRQGDRTLFLGREGSYARPHQLSMAAEDCTFRLGDVIAPCCSLRAQMQIPPGETRTVYFMTAAASTEEELAGRLILPGNTNASLSLAVTQAQMTLRFLKIDGRMLGYYQRMLGALAFSGQPHQALLPGASRNALWRMGVPGNLPLLFVRIHQGLDKSLIRHVLRAHSLLRMLGIWTDCVFFFQEETGYQRPDRDAVSQLLLSSPDRELINREGGVYLANGTEAEAREAESLARLALQGHLPLHAQLAPLQAALPEEKESILQNPLPVAPPSLSMENGFGGFTPENAYAVHHPSPVPWHNLLCNSSFGTLVSDTGILHSYYENSRLQRITRPCPDVHRGIPSEEIFLRDENGVFYPLVHPTVLHEPGVSTYHTLSGSVYADLNVFTHSTHPMGVRSLILRSSQAQKIRIFYLVRFALGEHPSATRCQAEGNFAFARNGEMEGLAFAVAEHSTARTIAPAVLFGLQGETLPPALASALQAPGSAALFTAECILQPHEPWQLSMALGYAANEEKARSFFQNLLQEGAGNALRNVRAYWAQKLSALALFSGDQPLDSMLNRWLPYQARAARLMARMGPYQAGGAFGFRDQLQDLLVLLHTDAPAARAHILLCAAHQFPEGDVQHWWHVPARGVRTRISDDKLFLPYLTALYIRITGDESILNASAPYLASSPLEPQEDDRYENPSPTAWEEPLMQHCLRALDSVQLGQHDLPLMGSGDWNDGMNRVGGEHGESVWLGFFLTLVIKEFSPYFPKDQKEKYMQLRRTVLAGTENAWTGQWYLRAWYDAGDPMGGPQTDPPRIDLISQCFAVLGGAPREHARTALQNAVEKLYDPKTRLVRLLSPPFIPEENAGYIGAYLPGVRENGGQYTHAAPWLVYALCALGEYPLAWEIARGLLPCFHSDTKEKAMVYKLEPYVLAGDVYAGENTGRGGWSWYTGSAAWLYYTFITVLLGFEKQGNRARLSPCPEPGAEEYTLIYRFHETSYHFTASRDAAFATLDGEKLSEGWVTLKNDGHTHEARFPLRK